MGMSSVQAGGISSTADKFLASIFANRTAVTTVAKYDQGNLLFTVPVLLWPILVLLALTSRDGCWGNILDFYRWL